MIILVVIVAFVVAINHNNSHSVAQTPQANGEIKANPVNSPDWEKAKHAEYQTQHEKVAAKDKN